MRLAWTRVASFAENMAWRNGKQCVRFSPPLKASSSGKACLLFDPGFSASLSPDLFGP